MAGLGIDGVEIGHWTDPQARTGCTVIVLPEATVASGEVRGGAPATREFELLAPERLVETVDAVVLTGGSAFGLAVADGVMGVLEAEGRGFETAHGRVPIVVAMALYDLGVGDPSVRPGSREGRLAARARSARPEVGAVGAGTGATTSKYFGPECIRAGGLGIAASTSNELDGLAVTAVVAVNAAGSPDEASAAGAGLLGRIVSRDSYREELGASQVEVSGPASSGAVAGSASNPHRRARSAVPGQNTTLCALITNARLSKLECFWVAQGGHDGLARALVPAHTRHDGDAVVAAATGEIAADLDEVRLLAVVAVTRAVARATGS